MSVSCMSAFFMFHPGSSSTSISISISLFLCVRFVLFCGAGLERSGFILVEFGLSCKALPGRLLAALFFGAARRRGRRSAAKPWGIFSPSQQHESSANVLVTLYFRCTCDLCVQYDLTFAFGWVTLVACQSPVYLRVQKSAVVCCLLFVYYGMVACLLLSVSIQRPPAWCCWTDRVLLSWEWHTPSPLFATRKASPVRSVEAAL